MMISATYFLQSEGTVPPEDKPETDVSLMFTLYDPNFSAPLKEGETNRGRERKEERLVRFRSLCAWTSFASKDNKKRKSISYPEHIESPEKKGEYGGQVRKRLHSALLRCDGELNKAFSASEIGLIVELLAFQ